jgi:hypothetical protein
LRLPSVSAFSRDVLSAAGIDASALTSISAVLNSYQHTNALVLVCFSAFLARFENSVPSLITTTAAQSVDSHGGSFKRRALPGLIATAEMSPATANLVYELNRFGEDSDSALIASMYRHLAHRPSYLALVRTLLVPLHESGELMSIVGDTHLIGAKLGEELAPGISEPSLHSDVEPILAAVRRFVHHPIARMTSICSLIRKATPC